MKIAYLGLVALLMACGTPKDHMDSKGKGTKQVTAENFTDSVKVKNIISYLASDELQGRDSGSPGIEKAAEFIEQHFEESGVKPYFSSYRDTLQNFSKTAFNIVGVVPGNDPKLKNEYVVIGAHYDHIGILDPVDGDAIANGANDNASGTTTVLELARYFGKHHNNARSLLFVLFSAEEKGLLGSQNLAKRLKEQNFDLYVMLNYEMVGVPLVDKDYFMYVTGYERSNLAEICNRYANGNLVGFLPTAKKYNLFKRSDNYSFDEAFHVPSQTFCTFDFTNFEEYHKVNDEVELMDCAHMAQVVNRSIPMIEGIVNAPQDEIKYN